MAGEWESVSIGELAESVSDTHPRNKDKLVFLNTSDILLGKVLHRTYSNIADWPGQAKKSIRRDDILFSEIRPANGRWAYIDFDAADFVVSTKLMVIRPQPSRVVPRFLYHFLTSGPITRWLQHLAEARSGTFPQITFDQVAELEIGLPPLKTQGALAAFLDRIDNKIELNRRMSETLEAMARALFKSWFVDFDPVRAKAEGRDPGLPKAVADLFPDAFEDSEVGEIPRGWSIGTLQDFSSLNTEVWSRETRPATIRYVDLSNTKWGYIDEIASYAQLDAPSRAQRVLRQGDTIVGTVRPGNGSFALVSENGLTGSTGFAVLRPRQTHYGAFIYLAATRADNIEALQHLADGGAYPAVRPEVVAATQVVRPADELLVEFSRLAAPLLKQMHCGRRESDALAALRDTLLPKLISGELRVKDGERIAAKAV
jgi:type I restriction enzyme S subunit